MKMSWPDMTFMNFSWKRSNAPRSLSVSSIASVPSVSASQRPCCHLKAFLGGATRSKRSLVFALYNKGRRDARVTVNFASLGMVGDWRVRDLWRQKDLGTFTGSYSDEVWPHATTLVRMFPADSSARLAPGVGDIRNNATYIQFERVRPVDKPGRADALAEPCEDCPRNRRR